MHCDAHAGSWPLPLPLPGPGPVTQYPPMQTRPFVQSAVLRHWNCCDFRSTVQAAAHTTSIATSAFTSDLRS